MNERVPRVRVVRSFLKLRTLLGVSRRSLATLALASLLAGIAEAAVVGLFVQGAAALAADKSQIDLNLGLIDFRHVPVSYLLSAALIGVVARAGLQAACTYIPAMMGARAAARLRTKLIDAYLGGTWEVQAGARQGKFIDLLTNQTQLASEFATAVALSLSAIVTFGTLAMSAIVVSPFAFLGVALIAGILFLLLRPLTHVGQRQAAAYSIASEQLSTQLETIVGLAQEINAFGAANVVRRSAAESIDIVRRRRFGMDLSARLVWVAYQNLTMALMVGALLALSALPGLQLTSVGAVALILMRALSGGQGLQSSYHAVSQLHPFVDRVQSGLAELTAERSEDGTERLDAVGRIDLQNVEFGYLPGRPVLRGLSAAILPGQLVAVVGPSGTGKSTLLELLLGLRLADSGEYLIDGRPASCYLREDWARRVAYVPQEARVLHSSVIENIRFFRNLDEEAIVGAAKQAQIHIEITELQDGYETQIGQRALALSGGQRQRLCLARALAGGPDLLILDEPTSAVDGVSEALIHDSLAKLRGQVTTIVVAHGTGILSRCDQVLVLRNGKIQKWGAEGEIGGSVGQKPRVAGLDA